MPLSIGALFMLSLMNFLSHFLVCLSCYVQIGYISVPSLVKDESMK